MKECLASSRIEFLQKALRLNALIHISLLSIAFLQKEPIQTSAWITVQEEFKILMKRIKLIESNWCLSIR